jgi:hypothetical protein
MNDCRKGRDAEVDEGSIGPSDRALSVQKREDARRLSHVSKIASTTSWTTLNSKLGVSLEAATRRHVFVDIHPTALVSIDERIK